MMKKIGLGFGLILLWLGMLVVTPTMAQSALKLKRVEIDLWPEYDQPAMLVIYHVFIDPAVTLPVNLSLEFPAHVGKPFAVAARSSNGELVNIGYDRRVSDNIAVVNILASSYEIQFEYYDPAIARIGNLRKYTFTWPGNYGVDDLSIQVQQPGGAEQMEIAPKVADVSLGSDGLMYHTIHLGSLVKGQRMPVNIEYLKATDSITAAGRSVEPITPLSQLSPGRLRMTTLLPWLLGVLGLVLIAGGGYWYWRSGIHNNRLSPRRRHHEPVSQPETSLDGQIPAPELAELAEGDAVYCHECGQRAQAGDRYCRLCGTQLRTG